MRSRSTSPARELALDEPPVPSLPREADVCAVQSAMASASSGFAGSAMRLPLPFWLSPLRCPAETSWPRIRSAVALESVLPASEPALLLVQLTQVSRSGMDSALALLVPAGACVESVEVFEDGVDGPGRLGRPGNEGSDGA